MKLVQGITFIRYFLSKAEMFLTIYLMSHIMTPNHIIVIIIAVVKGSQIR